MKHSLSQKSAKEPVPVSSTLVLEEKTHEGTQSQLTKVFAQMAAEKQAFIDSIQSLSADLNEKLSGYCSDSILELSAIQKHVEADTQKLSDLKDSVISRIKSDVIGLSAESRQYAELTQNQISEMQESESAIESALKDKNVRNISGLKAGYVLSRKSQTSFFNYVAFLERVVTHISKAQSKADILKLLSEAVISLVSAVKVLNTSHAEHAALSQNLDSPNLSNQTIRSIKFINFG